MAEYEDRENKKFNNLGNQLGGIVTALSAADAATKAAALDRQVKILSMENIHASANTTVIGQKDPLSVSYDVPAAIVSDMRALVVEEATIDTTMNVNASTEDLLAINSKTTASGKASLGFGAFKATASFSATVGVNKNQKRKSDYSSSLDISIKMAQSEAPEGIMRIIDSMNEVVKTATEINTAVMIKGTGTDGGFTRGNSRAGCRPSGCSATTGQLTPHQGKKCHVSDNKR